jgi:hypothetical protein
MLQIGPPPEPEPVPQVCMAGLMVVLVALQRDGHAHLISMGMLMYGFCPGAR